MLKFVVSIITDPLFGIASVATGFLFGHWFAQRRNLQAIRITEFNKGAAEFRAAFVDYIYAIRNTELPDADYGFAKMNKIHTPEVTCAHEKAKIRFEPFLEKSEIPGFNAAWEKYCAWGEPFHNQEDKSDRKPIVLGHIYAVLKYAEPSM